MFPRLLRIVALLSGRIFVGPALNRNEAWITSAINFTTDVFEGGRKIKMWHPLLRPIAQYFIPEIRKIHAHHRRVYKLLLPTLKARAEAERKPGYQKPDDLIQWLMDRATAWEELDFKVQASTLLVISLAAIHTSTMAVTHAVYDLAARPEYLEPLREEITQVLAAEGGFTKRAMMRMRKLDSFLKESQRHSPFALIGFLQKVVHPITLPSGPLLPAGTIFCVPNSVLDREAGIWSDPHAFDGFRYSTLRDSSPDEGRKHAFSEVSQDSMHFGYGGHTCPGRFFATNEIKLIIAHLVLGFDLGLREKGVRPRNVEFALQVLPDPTVEVLMRRRG
ncbi:hypothetical protein MMC30_000470 [Trapelia coarctata]|nr:hypothetical protein [Trapelia coarctata]